MRPTRIWFGSQVHKVGFGAWTLPFLMSDVWEKLGKTAALSVPVTQDVQESHKKQS